MARKLIGELKNGDAVNDVFLLRAKALRTTRTGSLFLHLELCDRSGRVEGRLWDATQELFDQLPSDDGFVRARGRAELFQNRLQIVLSSIQPHPETDVDLADFLPTTNKDVNEMFDRLAEIARQVKHVGLRKLLGAFFKDAEFCEKFRRAPAAIEYHHAFLGGLLEHTLSVAEIAIVVADHYPDLDRDMLLTGVILHDIGKVEEFAYRKTFTFTDAGELLGHLYIGARMVEQRAGGIPELTPQTTEALAHLILSHHGEYEYHSPKLPMTAEALAVHHLDNLDAKIGAFRAIMLRDRDPESRWTEWSKMFERKFFKGPTNA